MALVLIQPPQIELDGLQLLKKQIQPQELSQQNYMLMIISIQTMGGIRFII
jgi:hypothetical protein